MRIDFQQAADILRAHDNILIITHRNPDGDAVGSTFAMYRILVSLGKKVRVLMGNIEQSAAFIEAPESYVDFEPEFVLAVDTADAQLFRAGTESEYASRVGLCIDHHSTNTLYAENTLLDETAAAACEAIYDLMPYLGVKLNKEIAECLYVGISTDTGCFRYANTTSRSLRTAAELYDTGIDSVDINRRIFETKSKPFLHFETMALNSVRLYCDGKCAVMMLTDDMYKRAGISESETHAIASLPRQIEGVLVGITVKERGNGAYRVSLRTNEPVDASEICGMFGGGGHKLAAGCDVNAKTIQGAVNLLLKPVTEILDNLK